MPKTKKFPSSKGAQKSMYDEVLHVLAKGGMAYGGSGVKSALSHGLLRDVTSWKDTFKKYEVTPKGMSFFKQYRESRDRSPDGAAAGINAAHAAGASQFMIELNKSL